ncbi:MAG: TraB/GumN family protein [Parachlamydiaceae bacterium]|nr:TraB/GumN family protein [Parachlamydiaceae bacterium]
MINNEFDTNNVYKGFIYEIVDSSGNNGFLAGSIHIGEKKYKVSQHFKEALDNADELFVEFDLNSKSFKQVNTDIVIAKILLEADLMKIPRETIIKSFGATAIAVEQFPVGTEVKLVKKAEKKNIPISSLETAEIQARFLVKTIAELLDEKEPVNENNLNIDDFYQPIKMYKEGNSKYFKEECENQSLQSQSLLAERNVNMVNVMDAHFSKKVTPFFLVGTAHLYGEQGMVSLLREKGYTVKKMK